MKRIFIISDQSLFGQGLDSLLRQESGLDIVGCERDVDAAVERIKMLQPDVVLREINEPQSDFGQITRRILREHNRLKLIELSLQDNAVHVYCGERRVIDQYTDLLGVIEAAGANR